MPAPGVGFFNVETRILHLLSGAGNSDGQCLSASDSAAKDRKDPSIVQATGQGYHLLHQDDARPF